MNPYRVLQISPQAGQAEILQAVTRSLQRKEFTAREIMDAQKELMNPQTRKIAEFLYLFHYQPEQGLKNLTSPEHQETNYPAESNISEMPLIHAFDKF